AKVAPSALDQPQWSKAAPPLHIGLDEYRSMGYALQADGTVQLFRGDTLASLGTQPVTSGNITAFAFSETGRRAVAAFDTGHVRMLRLGFETSYPTIDDFAEQPGIAEQLSQLLPGQVLSVGSSMIERTPQRQFRQQRFVASVEAEFKPASTA